MGEPAGLLDDYLRIARYHVRTAIAPTAIRIRSLDMRLLLARAALGEAGTYADLLGAARAGDVRWLRGLGKQVRPHVLAGLAQSIALQEMLPDDRTDALAVLLEHRWVTDLARRVAASSGTVVALTHIPGAPGHGRVLTTTS